MAEGILLDDLGLQVIGCHVNPLDRPDRLAAILDYQDTYWVYRGGHASVAWMRRYPDRVILLLQKDFPDGASQPGHLYDGVVDIDATITMETFERDLDPATPRSAPGRYLSKTSSRQRSSCRTCSTSCSSRTSAATRIWSRSPGVARPSARTAG